MTAVPIYMAPVAMRTVLREAGPTILKTLTRTKEVRLQVQPGDDDKSGPHFEGRAIDIFLFAEVAIEHFIGEQLAEFLLARQDMIKWHTLIYYKRQWTSKEAVRPRLADPKKKQGRDFEHKTHIHMEWTTVNRDFNGFKTDLTDDLKSNYSGGDFWY